MKLLLIQEHFKLGDDEKVIKTLEKNILNAKEDFVVLNTEITKVPYTNNKPLELNPVINNYLLIRSIAPIVYQRKDSKARLADICFSFDDEPFYYDEKEKEYTLSKDKITCVASRLGSLDKTIYKGCFTIFDKDQKMICKTPYFESMVTSFDTSEKNITNLSTNKYDNLEKALVLGIKNYVDDNHFKTIALGLSGGVDSALVSYLSVKAVGKENVYCYALPSKYSTSHSLTDAKELASNLGCNYNVIEIKDTFNTILNTLNPFFNNKEEDLTEQNIQARIRGLFLMALSNKHNHLILATSNKSEVAVGYSTLYGDTVGAIEVIGDVYKTEVYKLCENINKNNNNIIPINILTKEPSAELREDQKDSDSLPEYNILDSLIEDYAFNNFNKQMLYSKYEKSIVDKVIKLININEYKRRQCPFILNVSKTSFSNRDTFITKVF